MIIDSLRSAALSGLTLCVVMACADAPINGQDNYEAMRQRMVDTQIRARDVRDAAVLQAMARVPRHLFVPDEMRPSAYEDRPLAIGRGQTISQPYIVAIYDRGATADARAHGAGDWNRLGVSGRRARGNCEAGLQHRDCSGARRLARRALSAAGYRNVDVRTGNGYLGWPERAPFDRIIVTAAPPEIPQALVDQLAVGGIMVVPVGTSHQEIVVVTKTPTGATQKRTIEVRFVPMVSKPPN